MNKFYEGLDMGANTFFEVSNMGAVGLTPDNGKGPDNIYGNKGPGNLQ